MTPQLTSALPKSYDFTILIMILTTMNATTTIEARENIVPKDESESSSTFLNSYAREKVLGFFKKFEFGASPIC
jgi:hypothetical protein